MNTLPVTAPVSNLGQALPHDVGSLHTLVRRYESELTERDAAIAQRDARIEHLQAQVRLLLARHFAPSAAMPVQPLPRSLASPGLLAHVATAKYADALPLYRQHQPLKHLGVDLSRTTLATWMVRTGALVVPLINLLREELLERP